MDSSKQQYFIAIIPPEPAFTEIKNLKQYMSEQYFSNAALRSPAHLTLHMPFQWKKVKEKRLFETLSGFAKHQSSFEITLNGFGCFEPRVVYVNVERNELLNLLQSRLMDCAKVDLNLFNANYRERPFHPHITIAFRNLKKTIFSLAWKEFQDKIYSASFLVDSISLLKHNGKCWDVYKIFKLNF